MFTGVVGDDIEIYWPMVEPLIQKALDKTNANCFWATGDIKMDVLSRNKQLWIALDDDMNIEAAFITAIEIYPRSKVFTIPFVGGSSIEHWLTEAWGILKSYGKHNNCKFIRGYGRKGWTRVLPERPEFHVLWDVDLGES